MFRSERRRCYIREQECARSRKARRRRGDAADQQSTGRRLGFIPLSPRSSPEGACANSVSGPHMCRPQRHARTRLSSPKLSGPVSDWWRSNQPGGHGGHRRYIHQPTSIKRPNETKLNYGPTRLRDGRSMVGGGGERGAGRENRVRASPRGSRALWARPLLLCA